MKIADKLLAAHNLQAECNRAITAGGEAFRSMSESRASAP